MERPFRCLVLFVLFGLTTLQAQRQMEALGRGVVAIKQSEGVYVSWRLLAQDPDEIGFNVYRTTGTGEPVRLNETPIAATTDFVDAGANPTQALRYHVKPVLGGVEQPASGAFTLPAGAPARPYLSIPLSPPTGGVTPDNVTYTYVANDCSVGDLDGDGEYELVLKWDPTNAKDNSQSGYTGNVFLDGYRLDGTRLWRIDLGRNVRAGAHYTQFMVYDFDGDGRAEVACKTADATVDGIGAVIGDAAADHRNSSGYVLLGREFLTVFDGRTGAALATADFVPPRNGSPTSSDVSAWGDNYGNRVDRFLAGVAYLDGRRPSLIMARGYYTRAVVVAWNWRDGQLTRAWTFDSDDGTPGNAAYRGQGNHNLSIADVDQDGRDEIVYGSCTINDDGKGLYANGLAHGDALHVSDFDPDRPGQEVWQCHESVGTNGGIGLSLRDARTGALLWKVPNDRDTGRALAADIDPTHAGAECWGAAGGLYSATGATIGSTKPAMNFAVWWDDDPLREILDSNRIYKWDWTSGSQATLLTAENCTSNNGTKSTPAISADLLGDWREEVVWRTTDNTELRLYTTTIPAASRLYTLMHDAQYRTAIAWQNTAYNQPPHPSFFLGHGMRRPPTPLIRLAGVDAAGARGRMINMSIRANAADGSDTLVAGFTVSGAGERALLVRAVGPTLTAFAVPGALADPQLNFYGANSTLLGANDNWGASPGVDELERTANSLGAFALPRSSKDSAMLLNLAAGGYTAHVVGAGGARGATLVEMYAGPGAATADLSNASVRARAGGADGTLIVGFIIDGTAPRTVLLRAVGPELAAYDVGGAMADPRLTLYRGETVIAQNDDWAAHVAAGTFQALYTFPLPLTSKDSALLLNLPPGGYTVHAGPASGAGGVVLVEVYAQPE